MTDVQINDKLTIPQSCLDFQTSRSSGPGGQNVNKLNTRVTLIFDLLHCPTLSDFQRTRLRKKFASRIDRDGRLHLSSQRYRSQHANRQDALERFKALIAEALKPRPKRRKTTVPAKAIRQRLEQKKRRSAIKRLRDPVDYD
ncbi:MAG TPA: aminoacyl-tRNA hydrolase [Phycisphaerales bacterium]|nr:aminoacyl-tRNA hydrolase [Phycisphaerales bacterium]